MNKGNDQQTNSKLEDIPKHIGFIVDGHRRHAEEKGNKYIESYRSGAKKSKESLFWCTEMNIKMMTYYAMSRRNLDRCTSEKSPIFKVLKEVLYDFADDQRIHEQEININIIGAREMLPEYLQKAIQYAESNTQTYERYILNIAIAYSGRLIMLESAKSLLKSVKKGQLDPDQITISKLEDGLYDQPMQPVDLIIRTSGEVRTSGFLPWFGNGYNAVFYVSQVYFPELTRSEIDKAINLYNKICDN